MNDINIELLILNKFLENKNSCFIFKDNFVNSNYFIIKLRIYR